MTESRARRFSHSASFGRRLDRLAGDHYNGNVSALIRAAVADHKRTLNGNDEYTLQALLSEIEQLGESIEDIEDAVERPKGGQLSHEASQDTDEGDEVDTFAAQRTVHSLLMDKGEFSFDDITKNVDIDQLAVREAIEALIEKDYITKESAGETTSYQISG